MEIYRSGATQDLWPRTNLCFHAYPVVPRRVCDTGIRIKKQIIHTPYSGKKYECFIPDCMKDTERWTTCHIQGK